MGMTIRVRFISADGRDVREVVAHDGDRLLELAQADGQPLEGTCEGQMACSTCHVIVVDDDFDKLPRASEEEDDLLDLAAHVTRTSRLACQIELREHWESLTVRMPGDARNMQGR
jgi:ferredoxin